MSDAAGIVVTEMNTPMRVLVLASVSDTTPTIPARTATSTEYTLGVSMSSDTGRIPALKDFGGGAWSRSLRGGPAPDRAICVERWSEVDVVAHERCDACGFDGARYDDASLLDALRALGPRWRALLAATGSELRVRPEPEVWSAIEYAAHSRDIIVLHAYGVEQALTLDEPMFPPIADDLVESAAATYGDADPDDVSTELTTQASLLAEVADDAGSDAWSRGLTIGDARSDVRRLLEHALHYSLHHLGDVERGLSRLRE